MEEENKLYKKLDRDNKIELEQLNIANNKNEQKIYEVSEKLKIKKYENETTNINMQEYKTSTEKEINNLKKEIECLKLKSINCEKLEKENEKLVLLKKQKDVEIKDLNNLIKKLRKEIVNDISSEEHKVNEEDDKENYTEKIKELTKNLAMKEKEIIELKEEKNTLKEILNRTRIKLTENEAKVKSQSLLLKKININGKFEIYII